jgi:hypothetical protein
MVAYMTGALPALRVCWLYWFLPKAVRSSDFRLAAQPDSRIRGHLLCLALPCGLMFGWKGKVSCALGLFADVYA